MTVKEVSLDHVLRMTALKLKDTYMLVQVTPETNVQELVKADCFVEIDNEEEAQND